MKSIVQTMLEEIYEKADRVAKGLDVKPIFSAGDKQVDEYGYYFITLDQLETILKSYQE